MTRKTSVALTIASTACLIAGLVFMSPLGAGATQDEKHGGNVVFEVKKNRQNRPHVLFNHDSHISYGHECKDCHNDKTFSSKKKLGVNKFTMKDINQGKACGSCHDGKTKQRDKVVFGPKRNCERCHNVKFRAKKR